MEWTKYINNNSKINKYGMDCQLVTAVNAYYHFTSKIIKQYSNQYKELSELCGCCYGSCIDITKAWKKLGILEDKRFKWYDFDKYLKANCFIELSIWHKRYGYHSVAIVDYEFKTESVRITNFKWATSMNGWAFLEDIKPFIIDNPDKSNPIYHGRTLKLV